MRFYPFEEIKTDAVLSLDEDVTLVTDEVSRCFANSVCAQECLLRSTLPFMCGSTLRIALLVTLPAIITGTKALLTGHIRLNGAMIIPWCSLALPSTTGNQPSIGILYRNYYYFFFFLLFRYYGYLYSHSLSASLIEMVNNLNNCEDILFNMLVSHFNKKPPIKIGLRRFYKEATASETEQISRWFDAEHFHQRHFCVHYFADSFGYMPLMRSSIRLDPILFKDPVSILRKKYRQMEGVS